jgi:ribonucleoside-diphosphate reductase alpha chain
VTQDVAEYIWRQRYRHQHDGGAVDHNISDTWRRVATALAGVERSATTQWARRFFQVMTAGQFIPGGRIIAGAGTGKAVTLFNCFVMGRLENRQDKIADALQESIRTMEWGGGIGYDFSTLSPQGAASAADNLAAGPVATMKIWNATCAALLAGQSRRGAMMATLRCDHPDIEAFIAAKAEPNALRHFNCSVLIGDQFIQAVEADRDWMLAFPAAATDSGTTRDEIVLRHWPGTREAVPCRVYKRLPARELWLQIMNATYRYAEPGVLFIDRINRRNNLYYCEEISATNPCGEIPLPPYGACDLGSLNLTRFVIRPFAAGADFNWQRLREVVPVAVRMLDNVIDVSQFPLPQQAASAKQSRRIGLGIMGLADCLAMLNVHYGSASGRSMAAAIMRAVRDAAYAASIELAREKGAFPLYERDAYLAGENVRELPPDLRQRIDHYGIRNSHLTAIAPTGTISLLAGNVSSGIEPLFQPRYQRRVKNSRGDDLILELEDFACRLWRAQHGDATLPQTLVAATELSPRQHLEMVGALQPYIDSGIAKTIFVPESCDFATFQSVYLEAYRLGLKGCTTFRPNAITGSVLSCATPLVTCAPESTLID